MTWSFLQDVSRAVSRFSRGPVAAIFPSALFSSNWVAIPDWIEKMYFSIRSEIVIVFDPVGSKVLTVI